MNAMIEATDICKRMGTFELAHVSFRVDAGEVVGLVGSNGAGKTTTLKALLGIVEIDSGHADILGVSLDGERADISAIKEDIGVVFDTCAFPQESKVRDVELMGRLTYYTWNRQRFVELCRSFDLASDKRVKELSRGMGMKLTLAFALAHDPRVLILDEATAGLDPLARDEILDMLRDFMTAEDRAILLSTHITTDLEKIADRIICLDEGRIIFDVFRDDICDCAGIARCRTDDVDALRASALLSSPDCAARIMRNAFNVDVLVPDRFAFAQAFPTIACDRATVEDYMAMMIKGEAL